MNSLNTYGFQFSGLPLAFLTKLPIMIVVQNGITSFSNKFISVKIEEDNCNKTMLFQIDSDQYD